MPSVAGDVDGHYWPSADVASGEIGFPLNLFIDLRTMQIYGRFSGGMEEMLMIESTLTELATEPGWDEDGNRIVGGTCGSDDLTETEPNGLADTPEDGTSLPFTMTGATCAPSVVDGFVLDEDVIDIGTLAAGTAINVEVNSDAESPYYPFFSLLSVSGTSVTWQTYGPNMLGVESAARTWVIEETGHYYVAVFDGRVQSSYVYGEGVDVPIDEQCCYGGDDYTYTVTIDEVTLEATEEPLATGDNAGTLDDGQVNVHPLEATSGTSYDIRLISGDTAHYDPYVVLYDPASGDVLAANDDEAYPDNTNSYVSWTAPEDMTVYVISGYWGTWFLPESPPTYTIRVE